MGVSNFFGREGAGGLVPGGGSPIFQGGLQFFKGSPFFQGSPIFGGVNSNFFIQIFLIQIFLIQFFFNSNFFPKISSGMHPLPPDMVTERPVRILLECILVVVLFPLLKLKGIPTPSVSGSVTKASLW